MANVHTTSDYVICSVAGANIISNSKTTYKIEVQRLPESSYPYITAIFLDENSSNHFDNPLSKDAWVSWATPLIDSILSSYDSSDPVDNYDETDVQAFKDVSETLDSNDNPITFTSLYT